MNKTIRRLLFDTDASVLTRIQILESLLSRKIVSDTVHYLTCQGTFLGRVAQALDLSDTTKTKGAPSFVF